MHRILSILYTTRNAFIVSDAVALFSACALGYASRAVLGNAPALAPYVSLLPLVLLVLLVYQAFGLYPGILRPPSDELKWLSIGTCIGFLFLSFVLFLGQTGEAYSRLIVLLSFFYALLLVPLFRFLVRQGCGHKSWWGYPVVLFATPEAGANLECTVLEQRHRGLRLAASVPFVKKDGSVAMKQTPYVFLDDMQSAAACLQRFSSKGGDIMALVVTDGLSEEFQSAFILLASKYFRQVIVQSRTDWLRQFSLHGVDIPGGPAVLLRQNLLDPRRMRMKRLLDLLFCFLGSAVLIVLMPLMALWIRLDSKGPVFFVQERIGQNGKTIKVFKFRTMVADAQQVLDTLLEKDAGKRKEWEETQKLTDDPRLTRAGAFLRHTSLDELPQIINVIKGDMSLVGPRPIVASEIERYGDAFALYTRVKPGITGLWQVSGRNDVEYAERVNLDQQYVYNWSVWGDIYIILRTFPILLSGKGAY